MLARLPRQKVQKAALRRLLPPRILGMVLMHAADGLKQHLLLVNAALL